MSAINYVTALQHIGIPTDDTEKTVRFYESLGFSLLCQTKNPSTGGEVDFLRLKNLTVEIWADTSAGKAGAIDHIALNVTDVDGAFQEMKKSGFHLLDKSVRFLPFWDHGIRFFTIEGPNGERIEFNQILKENLNV